MAKRVLVVDDDENTVRFLSVALRENGYDPISAYDGEEGFKRVEESNPDLILLDVILPGISGFDVCRQLRRQPGTDQIPVIVVTAKAAPIDKVLWMNVAQVDDYVTKPFGPHDLLTSVERVLARHAGRVPASL